VEYISQSTEEEMSKKISAEKWSKKEMLGHLIDSGFNNLKRFTEVQFEDKPLLISGYEQNELVRANDCQHRDTNETVRIWWALNRQIKHLIAIQTEDTLRYKSIWEMGTSRT